MKKRIIPLLLTFCLLLALPVSANAAERNEEETAAAYLFEMGIMVGDQSGNMLLDSHLTRAQLATILTRLNGNSEHVQAEQAYYIGQCKFSDVPEWAKLYVGYCYANGLMLGYDTGAFGADDGVTPQAACTVILRYLDPPDVTWDYSTACQTALDLGLTTDTAVNHAEVTRGDLAVMLYRALGHTALDVPEASELGVGLSRNSDGSINLPSDGSQYVPQVGDVIRCDDGTNYTITDVSRWDKSMFASGPIGPLPEPTCDWSLLDQPELPAMEVLHFQNETGDHLRIRNLYETRRMLYTLYNAIGNNPMTWQNDAPVLTSKGNQLVNINLSIPDGVSYQVFWPWRESEIINLFNSVPPGTYSMQAWDVYKDGVYSHTEYQIHVI